MLSIVHKVAVHLCASAKRLAIFRLARADASDENDGDIMRRRHTLRKFSDTRWSSRCDALTTFKAKFSITIAALKELSAEGDTTAETLLAAISKFKFYYSSGVYSLP